MRTKLIMPPCLTSIFLIGVLSAMFNTCKPRLERGAGVGVPCSPVGSYFIKSMSKTIYDNKEFGQVTVAGRWRAASKVDPFHIPAVNSFEITCNRAQGTCLESLANLYTELDGNDGIPPGLFFVRTQGYRVAEWTDLTLLAVSRPREEMPTLPKSASVSNIEVRINFIDRTVTRTRTTSAWVTTENSPEVQLWVLE